MTRSMMALVAAVGCWGTEPSAKDPLLAVRRIYVDQLTGESAGQVRDMIINALHGSRLFVVTEKEDKADACLKGSAEDLVFTDTFDSREGISGRASVGASGTSRSSTRIPGANVGISMDEATRTAERKHEARAAVRLVGKDGEVIWATTQESLGAKFRGASADVAEKIVRQLSTDLDKARRTTMGEQRPN